MGVDIFRDGNFSWNVLGTMSINRNKLVKLNSNLEYQLGPAVGYDKTYPSMFMEGMPLGIFWGAQTDGIYSTWEEANNSGIDGAAPGEIKYINHHTDLDSEGNPLAIQQITHEDYVQIGDPNPDFIASITNSFAFKNWDLSFLIIGQKGGDVLWVDSWPLANMGKSTNVHSEAFAGAWKSPFVVDASGNVIDNPGVANMNGAGYPAPLMDPGNRAIVSDRQIYDGSFIKLKNVNFGYNFKFKKNRSMRLYLSGSNLFIISNYPGYDPEVQAFNRDPQRRGIDFGAYPGTRNYVLGLKFNY